MSNLIVQEIADIWFEKFTKTKMNQGECNELLIMCIENDITIKEVEYQIHINVLKKDGILDLAFELKEKYENDIIKANETGETSLVDDFIDECFIREIHPIDVLLLINLELTKGDM